jgi:hypothetical protein
VEDGGLPDGEGGVETVTVGTDGTDGVETVTVGTDGVAGCVRVDLGRPVAARAVFTTEPTLGNGRWALTESEAVAAGVVTPTLIPPEVGAAVALAPVLPPEADIGREPRPVERGLDAEVDGDVCA